MRPAGGIRKADSTTARSTPSQAQRISVAIMFVMYTQLSGCMLRRTVETQAARQRTCVAVILVSCATQALNAGTAPPPAWVAGRDELAGMGKLEK